MPQRRLPDQEGLPNPSSSSFSVGEVNVMHAGFMTCSSYKSAPPAAPGGGVGEIARDFDFHNLPLTRSRDFKEKQPRGNILSPFIAILEEFPRHEFLWPKHPVKGRTAPNSCINATFQSPLECSLVSMMLIVPDCEVEGKKNRNK